MGLTSLYSDKLARLRAALRFKRIVHLVERGAIALDDGICAVLVAQRVEDGRLGVGLGARGGDACVGEPLSAR